jgi:uncharacterized protein (DUF2249 family)
MQTDKQTQINIPVHTHNHNRADSIYDFDARGIAKRFRHAAIFGALDSLMPGERMRFVNDHNPLPLLQQMQARYGDRVEINYLEQGADGVMIDFIVNAA